MLTIDRRSWIVISVIVIVVVFISNNIAYADYSRLPVTSTEHVVHGVVLRPAFSALKLLAAEEAF